MIIVTSGHVDHGKTALLQALTGTHTAHLPEEKKRGMTIDLGYAYLPLSDKETDKVLGFIDVPGHEKFLANMLAGLGGIHYAMLIVAADEGVKTQTEEHLAILRLLQVEQIIVVITKADKANTEQIEQLKQQLIHRYPELARSACFVTSSYSGQGIEELRNYLATLPNLADPNKPFRYAIDRIFSVKGAGTVVTGTAFSGTVKIDDELYLPNGSTVRIKNIHAQNRPSRLGLAGQRLALNISSELNRTEILRGDWLFSQPPLEPTDRVTLQLSAEMLLKENQPVHIYHAAAHVIGKLNLLTAKSLQPNEQGLAELILDTPLFLAYNDKLILRSGDAKRLAAGAKVLEINSPKRHKKSEARLSYLAQLQTAKLTGERIALYLRNKAVSAQQLMWTEQLTHDKLSQTLLEQQAMRFQDWCFTADYQQREMQKLTTALTLYHEQHGDQLGLGKARLYRMAAINQPEKLIYHFIDKLLAQGSLAQTRGWLHLPEHSLQFSTEERNLWQLVQGEFAKQGGQALWVRELANALGYEEGLMRNFLYKTGKLGFLTAVVKDRFFLTEDIYRYAQIVKQIAAEQGEISVNQLRDQLHFGRKLTVQLTEYFDRCGFLRRKGNVHVLRDEEIFDQ